MSHVIRYFRDGEEVRASPSGSLEAIKKIAADGMASYGMGYAVITDPTGAVVWASVNHTPKGRWFGAEFLAAALRALGRLGPMSRQL